MQITSQTETYQELLVDSADEVEAVLARYGRENVVEFKNLQDEHNDWDYWIGEATLQQGMRLRFKANDAEVARTISFLLFQ